MNASEHLAAPVSFGLGQRLAEQRQRAAVGREHLARIGLHEQDWRIYRLQYLAALGLLTGGKGRKAAIADAG
jgi:hypothetical protein